MTIARIGNYALKTKNYIGDHKYTTHDIELVKYNPVDKSKYSNPESVNDEYCYSIADFDNNGNVISLGTRLIDAIYEDYNLNSIDAIKTLIDIGTLIFQTENINSNYTPNNDTKCWVLNSKTGLLDEVE